MNNKSPLLRLREIVQSKFWLVPSFVALGLSLLLWILEFSDLSEDSFLMILVREEGPSLEAARLILSSIATALMTVISVLFSITIVVLQQVSSQYSPRVIENFIRSFLSQIVLGLYIGTFCFSLLGLLVISGKEDGSLPETYQVAVNVAVILSVACLALLIFYIHHIVKSIKSNHILRTIRKDTLEAVWKLDSDLNQLDRAAEGEGDGVAWSNSCPIHSSQTGYLQEIHWYKATELMKKINCHIRSYVMAGDFIQKGALMAEVLTNEQVSQIELSKLKKLFSVHIERTYSQDPRFGLRQMTDIALRALSPGINDPSTAIEAVNEIGAVLAEYTKSQIKPICVRSGDLSFLDLTFPSYAQVVGLCFDQIMASGRDFYSLLLQVRTTLRHCLALATDEEHNKVLELYDRQVGELIDKLNQDGPLQILNLSQTQLEQ